MFSCQVFLSKLSRWHLLLRVQFGPYTVFVHPFLSQFDQQTILIQLRNSFKIPNRSCRRVSKNCTGLSSINSGIFNETIRQMNVLDSNITGFQPIFQFNSLRMPTTSWKGPKSQTVQRESGKERRPRAQYIPATHSFVRRQSIVRIRTAFPHVYHVRMSGYSTF